MSNPDGRGFVAVATAGALLASGACALVLHTAATRTDAWWLVVVTTLWGMWTLLLARRSRNRSWVAIVVAAALVRLPLVGTPPLLSDDLFRYIFEGIALNAGHNPFLEAPASLTGLADPIREQVNHPTVTTIYPPLALWWFRLLGIAGTTWATQLATALVDLVTPVAILIATRRAWPAWVYALHPLPVLEAAHGAHIDVVAVALAAVGVAAWRRGYLEGAWWALVGGAAVKLLPAVALPAVWRRVRHRGARVVATVVVMLLLASPVLGASWGLVEGFRQYADRWAFNGLVFSWIEGRAGARFLLVCVGAGISAWAVWRHRDPGALWAVVGAAFVMLSPTVHPWYVLWALVPSLLQERRGWAIASVPLLLSYSVLASFDAGTGVWAPAPWIWWVTWPPAIAALLYARWRLSPPDSHPTQS